MRLGDRLTAGMRPRHARSVSVASTAHLITAFLLVGRQLRSWNGASSQWRSEQDHSQKRHENGAKAHKLVLPLPRFSWQELHTR